MPGDIRLFEHATNNNTSRATIQLGQAQNTTPINPRLLGKFCEHLGSNIYNGMEAQVLRNPTFGKWVFGGGDWEIDGGVRGVYDIDKIKELIKYHADNHRFPDATPLIDSYLNGVAFHWFQTGGSNVRCSPDVGPHGGRAQRVETLSSGPAGIAQRVYLPLHRTRNFEFRIVARAAKSVNAEISISGIDAKGVESAPLAVAKVTFKPEWSTIKGTLKIPAGTQLDAAGVHQIALTSSTPANIVIDRVLVYPDDHVNGADPDVIAMLKESKLPLLRWPGGNFVSGYRWRDGVGPVDARPTRPNPSWDGLEYNLFGTDEFVLYCRAVGCEPMICVNAGDGTPEEAAAWIEYCNGAPDSPMGRLRAANGFPEPHNIRLWEVGNEIYGRWQVNWTTPGGNADRYVRFATAMRAADPFIHLLGCGSPDGPNSEWNQRLLEEAKQSLPCITDHILAGGRVNQKTDFDDLYKAFLAYSIELGRNYRAQRDHMLSVGIKEPRAAITELQLFARPEESARAEIGKQIFGPATITEALYFATVFNECARLNGFVEMITHSATVNHGGGLRKTRERAWANPVHYAHVMYAPFAGATPLPLKVSCATQSNRGEYARLVPQDNVPLIDALAAKSADGKSLLLMLLTRSATAASLDVVVELGDLHCVGEAEVVTLSGASRLDANNPEKPQKIVPQRSTIAVSNSRLSVTLPAFTLLRVTVALA